MFGYFPPKEEDTTPNTKYILSEEKEDKETIKLVFCKSCGCHYSNQTGSCPSHGYDFIEDKPNKSNKT